ncbi:phage tail sheath family protein [Photorhabdus cinerea]|uniref:Phage tail sheath family protein n=1 Tax=Photorhabdus cinerea TaxID=471575 RepID=A0A7X5QC79_9GAMM|nr:phage tail sheath C-terminal domain-containing protein [Photorhabdus cinerea]NHB91631.1 phage tail sheath family protein [Photorhabdus cinerea]
MATQPSTPGVYIREDASLSLSVSQGNTAIPVFIGRFSPKDASTLPKVTRVNSWLDFTTHYLINPVQSVSITSTPPEPPEEDEPEKDPDPKAEPGSYTYTISAVSYTSSYDALRLYFQNGGGPCYILPLEDVSDSSTVLPLLPELIEQAINITLLVCTEREYSYKTVVYGNLFPLLTDPNRGNYFLIADSLDGETVPGLNAIAQVAAYYPELKIQQPPLTSEKDENVVIIGYEDAGTPSGQVKNLAQLKRINPPLYERVISEMQQAIANNEGTISTSAVMAGVYCVTDASRGVWKAPANIALNGIRDVTKRLTDDEQGDMNLKGINAIRYFTNKGFVVWGARTLKDDDNWRYIPVRRLFNTAERDIKQAMRFAIFEPNSQPTWKRVRSAIEQYLYQLWQQGALAGNSPQEAYFVEIGQDITMSAGDIKNGQMIAKVGMAAVRPAEFIILHFSQNVTQ